MHGRSASSAVEFAQHTKSNDVVDFHQFEDFFRRRWRLILAASLAVPFVSYLVVSTMTPRYTATAQLLLEAHKEKIFGQEQVLPELNLESERVDSQLAVLQSINFLRRVVEQEKLTQDPEFGESPQGGLMNFIIGLFKAGAPQKKEPSQGRDEFPADVLASISRLRLALDVVRQKGAYVFSISVTSTNPLRAKRLANAVADAYVDDQLEARYDSAKRGSIWFAERIGVLQEQLRQSEEAIAAFRKEHKLEATGGFEGKLSISDQQLSDLNGKLITAHTETAEKLAKYQQALQITERGGNLQAIPDVVRSNVISSLRAQQAEVARKEADLTAQYGDNHPLVINTRAQRRDVGRSIEAEVQRILQNLKNDYDVAKTREDSLRASLAQITGETGQDNGLMVRLRGLERVNQANKTLYENFLTRMKSMQEQTGFEEREVRVISPAVTPGLPSFPKKGLVVSLAGVVGLLLGLAGSVTLEMLNAGFTSAEEVERKLGRPVLASLPLLADKDRKIGDAVLDPPRYLVAKPRSRYAELVRSIRLGVQMSDVDNPAKALMVTSTIPSEGKSTLALSLVFSALKSRQKVLLIDADLRHPSIHKYFALGDRAGLVDFLTGAVPFEDAIFREENLAILPAGMKTQSPPDLLVSERFKQVMEKARQAYDYIVIDAPPSEPVVDARLLSALVDKVLFVVRWSGPNRALVAKNVEFFAANDKLAGVALSMVDEKKAPRDGAYAYPSSIAKYYHG